MVAVPSYIFCPPPGNPINLRAVNSLPQGEGRSSLPHGGKYAGSAPPIGAVFLFAALRTSVVGSVVGADACHYHHHRSCVPRRWHFGRRNITDLLADV